MSITLKVFSGALADDHKCAKCEHAHYTQDSHNGESLRCGRSGKRVTRKIVACNLFEPKGMDEWRGRIGQSAYYITRMSDGRVRTKTPAGEIIIDGVVQVKNKINPGISLEDE